MYSVCVYVRLAWMLVSHSLTLSSLFLGAVWLDAVEIETLAPAKKKSSGKKKNKGKDRR